MKRFRSILLYFLTFTILLTGCVQTTTPPEEPESVTQPKKTAFHPTVNPGWAGSYAQNRLKLPEGVTMDDLALTAEIPMYRDNGQGFERVTNVAVHFICSDHQVFAVVMAASTGHTIGVSYAPALQVLVDFTGCTELTLLSVDRSVFCQLPDGTVHPLHNPYTAETPPTAEGLETGSLTPAIPLFR